MSAVLDLLLGDALPWLIGAAGAVVAWFMAQRSGRIKAENKRTEERLDALKHKQEVEKNVANKSDDDLIAGSVRKHR